MKRTRDICIAIALVCTNVSAFVVPNHLVARTTLMPTTAYMRKRTEIATHSVSAATSLPSIPLQSKAKSKTKRKAKNGAAPAPAPAAPKSKKRQTKRFDEFQWLNWVYKQWRPTKPGELTEEVLKQMVPAISRWGRRKSMSAAERAEELLDRIIEENLAGNPHADLTMPLFNSAMDAHAKVGNPEGVQSILRKLESLRRQHKHLQHLTADVFSMSTLATAWARSRSRESASKAEGILRYMEARKLTPNTITYNAVLHALAMGSQKDKAVRGEDMLKHMRLRYEAGEDCKPDIYSFQSVILAWSRTSMSGSPQKAEQILHFLDGQVEKGNTALAPNAYCFTTAIHAWARSQERKRARSAYLLLNHMTRRYLEENNTRVKPNVVAFTAVLNACARPVDESEFEDAFKIAELTMKELSLGTFGKPNFLSYAAFLSVCSSTLDRGERRDEIVRKTFEECAEAGQVAKIVLEKLTMGASPELYYDLLGKHTSDDGDLSLPASYTEFIKGERNSKSDDSVHLSSKVEDPIPRSSQIRLKAVQTLCGKTGFYSSGEAPERLEAEGISWTKQPMNNIV